MEILIHQIKLLVGTFFTASILVFLLYGWTYHWDLRSVYNIRPVIIVATVLTGIVWGFFL